MLTFDQDTSAGLIYLLKSYRAENFLRTAEIYKELTVEKAFPQEQNDLRINEGAADAQLEWKGLGDSVQKKKPGREDLEAFETAYNAACGSIARGELSQAEILLKRAHGMPNVVRDSLQPPYKTCRSM
jgi:signal recognition particle subunit SRP72